MFGYLGLTFHVPFIKMIKKITTLWPVQFYLITFTFEVIFDFISDNAAMMKSFQFGEFQNFQDLYFLNVP